MAQTEAQKRWYKENRERILADRKAFQEGEGRERYLEYQRRYHANHLEKARQWKAKNYERYLESSREYSRNHAVEISTKRKNQRRQLKQTIINAYGGKCECCGEEAIEFLTIDHINGDGASHRRLLRTKQSKKLYEDLISRKFPSGLRVLCFNCNTSLGFYGYCPHHPELRHNPRRK